MRLAQLLLIIAAAASCQSGAAGSSPSASDAQVRALQALEKETGASWSVRYHEDAHTPAFLVGSTPPCLEKPSDAATVAESFLMRYRALFLMTAPQDELRAGVPTTDELGMTHIRFVQEQEDVPVRGASLVVHFDRVGAIVSIHGRYLPLPPVVVIPRIPSSEATQAALSAVAASGVAAAAFDAAKPELVIDALPVVRLAWQVEVRPSGESPPWRGQVLVDATTGESYLIEPMLDDSMGSGVGVLGNVQTLSVAERNGEFYLEDGSGEGAQKTYSAASRLSLPGTEVRSQRIDQWDEGGRAAGAAVDAHAYTSLVAGYFQRRYGRAGAAGDGNGMHVTAHFGQNFSDACWNGHEALFGDGDGRRFRPFAAALDVVGHEFTHAVIEFSADLDHDQEPGAIGESLADVFGSLVEHDARGDEANWTVGEDLFIDHDGDPALRDLANPRRLGAPCHISQRLVTSDDRGGIHANSLIASHAAFLVAVGGTHEVSGIHVAGIGNLATERIWYRALVHYLGPWSGFADLADATRVAARDLFGADSPQAAAVADAWRAVGVTGE